MTLQVKSSSSSSYYNSSEEKGSNRLNFLNRMETIDISSSESEYDLSSDGEVTAVEDPLPKPPNTTSKRVLPESWMREKGQHSTLKTSVFNLLVNFCVVSQYYFVL